MPNKMLASYCPALSPALPSSSPTEKALALRLLRSRSSCGSSNCLRRSSHRRRPLLHWTRPSLSARAMAGQGTSGGDEPPMKLLFVEMGVGYDQHGQDITAAAMRACRDAISSNSIPAFRRGSIPGVTPEHMKLQIKLGVPRETHQFLDVERVKSVFPYGKIINIEVVDGGLVCSSGVYLEAMGDKNEDCYVVNAAVYVGY